MYRVNDRVIYNNTVWEIDSCTVDENGFICILLVEPEPEFELNRHTAGRLEAATVLVRDFKNITRIQIGAAA